MVPNDEIENATTGIVQLLQHAKLGCRIVLVPGGVNITECDDDIADTSDLSSGIGLAVYGIRTRTDGRSSGDRDYRETSSKQGHRLHLPQLRANSTWMALYTGYFVKSTAASANLWAFMVPVCQ
jgi:hypothetical protein